MTTCRPMSRLRIQKAYPHNFQLLSNVKISNIIITNNVITNNKIIMSIIFFSLTGG